MSKEYFDKKIFERILLVTVAASFVLLLLTLNNSTKLPDSICGIETINLDISNQELYTSSFALDSNNKGFAQPVQVYDIPDYNKAFYCFTPYLSNSSNPHIVNVIDENLSVIGMGVVSINNTYTCIEIDHISSYIGIRCVDCNNANQITIPLNTLSNKVPTIHTNGSTTGILEYKVMDDIKIFKDCSVTTRFYIKSFLFLIAGVLVIALLLLLINETSKVAGL